MEDGKRITIQTPLHALLSSSSNPCADQGAAKHRTTQGTLASTRERIGGPLAPYKKPDKRPRSGFPELSPIDGRRYPRRSNATGRGRRASLDPQRSPTHHHARAPSPRAGNARGGCSALKRSQQRRDSHYHPKITHGVRPSFPGAVGKQGHSPFPRPSHAASSALRTSFQTPPIIITRERATRGGKNGTSEIDTVDQRSTRKNNVWKNV